MKLQSKIKLLDRVRQALRLKNFSYLTEKAHIYWIKYFILFRDKRHPKTMGGPEIEKFLSYLVIEGNLSSSTHIVPVSYQRDPSSLCSAIPFPGRFRI